MHPIQVIDRGREPYAPCFDAMRAYTEARGADTPDQIWLVEHPPVYTLGQAGDPAHLLAPDAAIPVVKIDRGGQITYHGPGQIVAYLLLDLRRRHLMVRELVHDIEQAVLDTLAAYNLAAERKAGAPGIYLSDGVHRGAKIAALGLKIRNGCSYHGVSLNVQMDLSPFLRINPCGYAGLETVDMATAGATTVADDARDGAAPLPVTADHQPEIARRLAAALCEVLAAREARAVANGPAAVVPVAETAAAT
ncbi:lipoyl(octanoyl) transferase LipB [Cupriavidus plantarum]|uniref:lipoyl(octanoyl) transferase LipB n=1 Tax=Cupriavidus plantarum TaxID=942865 RepID=UPI001B1B326B|nr:lipoyl(octanoyl) transferase LipB [Cupriavidus plantarum]CAG2150701.1 Octanoyltransferase [Cupriavidus plantarum]SMR67857.1 lipoyl(octanoyl) transferase [Cupriavidus plantarum]